MSLRVARQWLLVSLPLLLMLLACWASFGSSEEMAWAFRLHRNAHTGLRTFMFAVTDYGNIALYLVYAAILVRAWRAGDKPTIRFIITFVILQVAITSLLVRVIKISLGRPRPWIEGNYGSDLYKPMSLDNPHNSMPSGHTAEITGSSTPLALRYAGILTAMGLGLFMALVAFSRIYLGEHHVSDVFFGFVLGSFAGVAAYAFSPGRRG